MAVARVQEAIALDANFLIKALVESTQASVMLTGWVQNGCTIQISPIAWSEYMCGPLDPEVVPAARMLAGRIDTFTAADGEFAALLSNEGGRRSRSHADCMIAAHAIRRDAALATLDGPDFRRFTKFGLRLA
ncbi:MAG: type II toxin-antitoxin system VapC family toxin [Chthoniobacterales bacterium]